MRVLRSILIVGLLLAIASTAFARIYAQGNDVTISLVIPSNVSDIYNAKLISQFEDSHPGIKVNVVKATPPTPSTAEGLTAQLENVGKYVVQGDVLEVGLGSISAESTRAGYWLDLAPLVAEDK